MFTIENVVINPELKGYLRPLNPEERAHLVESVKSAGFVEAITVDEKTGEVVDGMNRVDIYHNELRRDKSKVPQIITKPFESLHAKKEFMLRKQLGRRNLNDAERCKLVLLLKPLLEEMAKENQRAGGKGLSNLPKAHTRKTLAKDANVSEGTLQKAAIVLESDNQQVKDDMLAKKISIHAAHKAVKPPKMKSSKAPSTVHEPSQITSSEQVPQTQFRQSIASAGTNAISLPSDETKPVLEFDRTQKSHDDGSFQQEPLVQAVPKTSDEDQVADRFRNEISKYAQNLDVWSGELLLRIRQTNSIKLLSSGDLECLKRAKETIWQLLNATSKQFPAEDEH